MPLPERGKIFVFRCKLHSNFVPLAYINNDVVCNGSNIVQYIYNCSVDLDIKILSD